MQRILSSEERFGLRRLIDAEQRGSKGRSRQKLERSILRDGEFLDAKEARRDMATECPVDGCDKVVSGEQGVRIHMSRMHPDISVADRDKLARGERITATLPGGPEEPEHAGALVPLRSVNSTAAAQVEVVNHPAHYGGDTPYEVIKVLEAWGFYEDALLFNAVKYIARAGKKDDAATDLRKAIFYIEKKIEQLVNTD